MHPSYATLCISLMHATAAAPKGRPGRGGLSIASSLDADAAHRAETAASRDRVELFGDWQTEPSAAPR